MASVDASSSAPSSRRRSCSATKSNTGITRSTSRRMARPSLLKEWMLKNVRAVSSGKAKLLKELTAFV